MTPHHPDAGGLSDPLEEHEAKGYDERRRVEVAICAFVATRCGCEPGEVSMDGIRWFIRWSGEYRPLLAALASLAPTQSGGEGVGE